MPYGIRMFHRLVGFPSSLDSNRLSDDFTSNQAGLDQCAGLLFRGPPTDYGGLRTPLYGVFALPAYLQVGWFLTNDHNIP